MFILNKFFLKCWMAGEGKESSNELLKLMLLLTGKRKGRKDGEEFNFDRFHPYFRTSFAGCVYF